MKIVRFAFEKRIRFGILEDETIRGLEENPWRSLKTTGERFRLADVIILAPCAPSKIIALGLNYRSHADEFNSAVPESPVIFIKPPTSVIGPEENIVYPPSAGQVDYECELAVIIGKRARNVSRENALDHVLGYTCLNDVTARDLQAKDGQWTRAKSFDTFAPIGPCIETELDPGNVPVETWLNGVCVQKGNTADLIFPVEEQIRFVSEVMTLLPGDIIATGTPGGIGPMQPGDTVEIKIAPIGTLRNYLVKEA